MTSSGEHLKVSFDIKSTISQLEATQMNIVKTEKVKVLPNKSKEFLDNPLKN